MIGHFRHHIGNQDFFSKAENKSLDSVRKFFQRMGATDNLPGNVVIPDDRTGNKLGKRGNVESEMQRIFLGRALETVDINDI